MVVACRDTHILLDCGLPMKQLQPALARLELDFSALDAVFVTHEHADHIRGLRSLCRRCELPVFMTAGTALGGRCTQLDTLQYIADQQQVEVGSLSVQAVVVPHDAREPCQYIVQATNSDANITAPHKLGLLTDLGCSSEHVINAYAECDALVLECNHDVGMLRAGPYPESVKRRVLSDWGHLSNQQACDLLQSLRPEKLQWLVLAHISQQNNSVPLALGAIESVFPDRSRLVVAEQATGFDWLELV